MLNAIDNVASICQLNQHPANRLRVIGGDKLVHETRPFPSISRFIHGDDRSAVLECIARTIGCLETYRVILGDLQRDSASFATLSEQFKTIQVSRHDFSTALDVLAKSYMDVNVTSIIVNLKLRWSVVTSR